MANTNQNFKPQPQPQKKVFEAAESTANAANAGIEKLFSQGKAHMEKLTQEATTVSRETAEVLTKSGSIFSNGAGEIFKTWTDLVQKAAERNSQAFKSFLGVRTLTEAAETQSRLAQDNLDSLLNGLTQLSEQTVRVLTATFEPITDHISTTVARTTSS